MRNQAKLSSRFLSCGFKMNFSRKNHETLQSFRVTEIIGWMMSKSAPAKLMSLETLLAETLFAPYIPTCHCCKLSRLMREFVAVLVVSFN